MADGEDAGTEVLAVLGGNPADGKAAVDGPLLVLTEAVLVAEVTIYIKVFTLISFVLCPLEVVVAGGYSESDVPSVDGVVLLTVAEPVLQFESDVTALVGVRAVAPDPPGPEHLALDTPAVVAAEREFHLSVRSGQSPKDEVGLDSPYPRAVDGLLVLRARLRQVDDGVADDERIAAVSLHLLFRHRDDDGRTRGAEWW